MSKSARLSAANIDQIAQFMRVGLGLALLGIGWNLIQVYQVGDFSADTLLSAIGITGILKEVYSTYILDSSLGTFLTPLNIFLTGMGLSLAGALFVFAGYWVRFYGALFSFLFLFPWLLGLYEVLPWVFNASDFKTLEGPVAQIRSLAMVMLFAVLANIGPGSNSIDHRFHVPGLLLKNMKWDTIALQFRFGLSILFLGAAASELVFGVQTYAAPAYLTLAVGILVFFGLASKIISLVALGTIGWHLWVNLVDATTLGQAMNIILPQAPFIAASIIYYLAGGGEHFKPKIKLTRTMWGQIDD